MKIFFSGHSGYEDVESSSPIEVNYIDASDILWNLDYEGSFIGIMLDNERVFQVMNEGDFYYSELLNKTHRETLSKNLDIKEVDTIIDQLFKNIEFEFIIEKQRETWKKSKI